VLFTSFILESLIMLNSMLPIFPLIIFGLAVIGGGFTNGLAGFAFAAVSGGIVFSVLPPTVAVSVLAVCGICLQICNNVHYFKQVKWKSIMVYAIPGFVGIPAGSHLLSIMPKPIAALVFGIILLGYVAFTFRKKPGAENDFGGRVGEAILGFTGGVAAGMLALPGIPVVIWATIRGYSKESQRALSVPFNFLMLLGSILFSGLKGNYHDPVTQAHLLVAVPCCLLGWAFGVQFFARISQVAFRQFISCVLVLSGILLVYPSVKNFVSPAPQVAAKVTKQAAIPTTKQAGA
jgi:uncharacterized membrane protein YfcA